MLAYKIVVGLMFGANVVMLTLKTAQAMHYKQGRLAIINAIGLAAAVAFVVWTVSL